MSVFDNINAPCCMESGLCVCTDNERVLRYFAYSETADMPIMNPIQREWCIQEADRFGEGSYDRESLVGLSDKDLAWSVIRAWQSYVS